MQSRLKVAFEILLLEVLNRCAHISNILSLQSKSQVQMRYSTGWLLFYPEKLVEDDVITGLVSFFYPDPSKTSFLIFPQSHDKIAFSSGIH